jgi:hypothetical protein
MDGFIITRLEALMNRSPVSPYDVARFFVVGMCGAWMLANGLSDAPLWVKSFFWIWALVCGGCAYRNVSKYDRENQRGFLNSQKRHAVHRYWCLGFVAVWVVLDAAAPDRDGILWLSATLLMTAWQYFQALNWTSPPPKPVRRSVFAEGAV